MCDKHGKLADAAEKMLRQLEDIPEDQPLREGIQETPNRVAKAWAQWTAGYSMDPESVLKVFKDGAESYDHMVVVRGIPVNSHCEHHMAAIYGTATVAYIPNPRAQTIIGLSKAKRLVDVFALRLQVQERLTTQIADALEKHVEPLGVGVLLRCEHMCMSSRGVKIHGSDTITTALRGDIKTDPTLRREFMQMAMEKEA